MNRKSNKFHRDIRDIVELSPEARRLLNEIKQVQLVAAAIENNKRTNKSISKKGDK